MARIAYLTNADSQSGMGKPAYAIDQELRRLGEKEIDFFALDGEKRVLKKNGKEVLSLRALSRLRAKPIEWMRLARRLPKGGYDLWHLTNQSLSFVRRDPAVVTVFDLIEIIEPQEKLARAAYRYLYSGIKRAARVMAISEYTKQTVIDGFGLRSDEVKVVPLAVGGNFYYDSEARESTSAREFRRANKIDAAAMIILYVGSEHPRKNLKTLMAALAQVREAVPQMIFLKVGVPGLRSGREALLQEIDRHNLRNIVRFVGLKTDKELQLIYSLADVFVFPSTFEGFGLPPLEAMACGTPVVCSNATSLPEVVGEAALTRSPEDVSGWAEDILRVLQDGEVARQLRSRGLARAKLFSWEKAARETLAVYQDVWG